MNDGDNRKNFAKRGKMGHLRRIFIVIKILFVCHGNICRSPVAEYIFNDMVKKRRVEGKVMAKSVATSTDEIWNGKGSPIYPPMAKLLNEHGIDCSEKRAKQLTKADYEEYDLLVLMDENNRKNAARMLGADTQNKIRLLGDYIGEGEIEDPWYTRNFHKVYDQIERGCAALLETLIK